MSNKIAGVDVLVKVNAGTDILPNVVAIGGQSGATLNRSTSLIEVTSKGSGWAESIAGIKNWSVECEGFMVIDDVALGYLEDAWMNNKAVNIDIAFGGKKYTGVALIEDFPAEFPQDDAVSISLSLTGSGPLVVTDIV